MKRNYRIALYAISTVVSAAIALSGLLALWVEIIWAFTALGWAFNLGMCVAFGKARQALGMAKD